ncbi:MAG: trehalose-6-phosphate synthase [Candidatus Micrarchaeota archaeon]
MEEKMNKIREKFGDVKLIVASSSEPYVHYYEEDEIKWRKGTGGVITALDPIMRLTNGVWIANSTGSADRATSDKDGKLRIPPSEESYTLKRIFLSKKEQDGFLSGAANGALWPLSHVVYVRPKFIDEQWEVFRQVNKKFAEAIAVEARDSGSVVWINDYHLVLCAKYLKEINPEIPTAFFWHIPWPNPQVFKICPWDEEILDAMLANDLLGFHTRYFSNNFQDSVDQTLEARVDRPVSSIHYKNREIAVRTAPISVDYEGIRKRSEGLNDAVIKKMRKKYGLNKGAVIAGVDRLDYTKGLPEKVKAIDRFLKQHPESIEQLTFIQIASPTRIHLDEYKNVTEELEAMVEEINWKYSTDSWRPFVLDIKYASDDEIQALYKISEICVVSSLHDGMNLVAKEYVSSKVDGNGVLILSKFAGSSLELKEALLVNPYSVSELSSAIDTALKMPLDERQARMKKMQLEVSENNVFDWSASFLEKAVKLGGNVA